MKRLLAGLGVWLGLWGAFGLAQSPRVELLLVDETRTLQGSLLVQSAAKALQDTGLFNLEAKFAQVQSSYDDPLGVNPTDKKYELIVIVPVGLENGSLRDLWIVTQPLNHKTRAEVLRGVQTIKNLIHQGSSGQFKAVGVTDDLIPALFSRLFAQNGWLK